jgi:hypothetical protein
MSTLTSLIRATAVAASLAGAMGGAQAVSATLYGTQAAFLAGLGGASTVTQDFNAMAPGTSLVGMNVLPGVTMSTNLARLEVFNSAGIGNTAFAIGRTLPESYYDINVNNAYTAFAFEVNAFDPLTSGPGFLTITFSDGDTTFSDIPYLPPATELTPIFIGVIADRAITKIRWTEGPELNFSCCEETVIDNLIAAQPVPEPGTALMMFAGLGAAGWLARRRRPVQ